MEKVTNESKKSKKRASLKTLIERNPAQKCFIITLIAVICITAGFIFKNPLIMVLGLLPAALYEAYRTMGVSTKAASIILLLILIFEAILIIFNINIDLAKIIGISKKHIPGYGVILMDVKTLIPIVIIFLSVILIVRTAGPYTKWLSVILIIGCFCVIYIHYPEQFNDLFNFARRIFFQLISGYK